MVIIIMANNNKNSAKDIIFKILNGLSTGVIVALIPGALVGVLLNLLAIKYPQLQVTVFVFALSQSLLPAIIGLCIGMQFNLTPIQTGSIVIATFIASGVVTASEGSFIIKGTGDVINSGVTATIALLVIFLIKDRLKAYTLILLPVLVILIASTIGLLTLPWIREITALIGNVVNSFTNLAPIPMGIVMGISFAFIIVSPISSVAIATAIGLTGIGAGAANLGIVGLAYTFLVIGFRANHLGTSVVHVLGTPKVQLANFIKKPKIIIPGLFSAMIMGLLATLFKIQGNPSSAGFGMCGFIGPSHALKALGDNRTMLNIIIIVLMYSIIPLAIGILSNFIFVKILRLVKSEDYKLEF